MTDYDEWVKKEHNKKVKDADKSTLNTYQRRLLTMIRKYGYYMTVYYDSNRNKTTCAIKKPMGKDEYGYDVAQTIQNVTHWTAEALEPHLYMHECGQGKHQKFDRSWFTSFQKYSGVPVEGVNS